jgi:hypothetical protein
LDFLALKHHFSLKILQSLPANQENKGELMLLSHLPLFSPNENTAEDIVQAHGNIAQIKPFL